MTDKDIIENHIKNVHPINQLRKNGVVIGYYTKMFPRSRNHSGKMTAKTEAELKEKIVKRYKSLEHQNATCREVIDAVVEDYYKNNQMPTGDTHRQNFYRCFSSFSNTMVKELTEKMIEDALNELISKGIKAKAFNKAVSTLNRIYDYCVRNDIPCVDIRTCIKRYRAYELSGKHKFIQDNRFSKNLAFNRKETVALINYAIENPTYKNLFIGLILTTGCRAGELLCMSFENLDIENHIFYVYEIEDCKTFEIKEFVKENHAREVFLNENAQILLKLLLDLRGFSVRKSKYLFLNPESFDGKLHLGAVDKYFRKLQVQLGFDSRKEIRSLHDGRRTYASLQYLNGVDINLIKAQLGHTTVSQTWEYIKDIIEVEQRKAELNKGCLNLYED